MAGLDNCAGRVRAVLRATLSGCLVAVLGVLAAPAAHAAAVGARLTVTSTWQTGFIASFTIVNSGTAPLTDWRLEFDLPAGESVSHTWSSSITQYGTHYVLTPANWTRIVPAGGSVRGGMRGVLSGFYVPPSNCMLNGVIPCS
jgi:hypothetical protein